MAKIYSVSCGGIGSFPISRSRQIHISILVCLALVCLALVCAASGQVAFPTGRSDNQRSGANVNETILTPSNVNTNQFGFLFNYSIDYLALAQPLYVPKVNIAGKGTYSVVYVATMADSVYAFDADSNAGANASPLWWVNFTDPDNGITLASGADLPCSGPGVGFTQEGISSTPVIDTTTGTLYVVAKTVENGIVRHRLHALDIASGQEKFGGPVVINATTTSNKGHVFTFNSLHQLNRPGLLLLNGVVYLAFGSNSCNDSGTSGWVLSYDAANLKQIAVFNTSPDHGLASIWQTGNGIAADEFNNIFVETAEACNTCYDIPEGGQTFSNSVLKLDPTSLAVTDYFTPFDVQFLNSNDEDLSSTGVLVLPDQVGATPHELVASGKQGFVYVLDRDSLGMYNTTYDQDLEEFPLIPGAQSDQDKNVLFSSPAYWNNTVYFSPDASPLLAYPLSGGATPLGTPLTTVGKYVGAHSPSISANGNANGVLWNISGGALYAFNATTLQELYNTDDVKSRDALPPIAHFATQTVSNGRVYVATQTTLQVYGLFPSLTLVSGGDQSASILTSLSAPIQLRVINPYSGRGIQGVTVTFSDGVKGGTFNPNPPSIVSDASGNVSIGYTFAKTAGAYTITAGSANVASLTIMETALPGAATAIIDCSGDNQTEPAGSVLPNPLKVEAKDAYGNAVPGVTVNFVNQVGAGILNPSSVVTNASGFAMTSYQLPSTAGTYKIDASAPGLNKVQFIEYATAGAASAVH